MAVAPETEIAVVLSAFFLPILTYLFFTRMRGSKESSAGPLPPPTEITNIFIHPIKSCHGLEVRSARLLPTGLDLDRQWMWVTYPDFEFLTIRNDSKMTLIRPTYHEDTDTLTVSAPAPGSIDEKLQFSIPAHPDATWLSQNTEQVDANIWGHSTPAHAYSTSLTKSFNDFFGKEVRLVYKSPISTSPRALVSNGAKDILGREASTCFPDLMPLLVGSSSSIAELNTRLQAAENLSIDVRRFRPNILVAGHKPWDEDRWKTLCISPKPRSAGATAESFTLDVTQRCARCQVPNVDPETAEKHKREPWNTLMKYRRVDEGITYKPCFGMLCVPRGKGGLLEVGMSVQVLEVTDKHRYIAGF